MSKMTFVAGFGLGYVLGARAGRQRFEQIKSGAQGVWNNPKVQETVTHAQDFAAQKAPEVQHRIAETASHAAHRVTDKVGSGNGTSTGSTASSGADKGPGTPAGFVDNPATDN
ncbi:hypothetical protein [Nocardioides bizhenqiangii]|uniref:YtxH domain-containing protein n=1 Tax=Nocardioides bizhenqiangii TaxID=3095076 RepID=A0ABZ0ZRE7_9ACTN|nr:MULTISPECIES: hypothetical protein [unclassified Nocardioides]MDZ5619634.1 hypothetical protein [Nocardioides sp. HM23]WQQ26354.1 hypothetical protein SHK19_20635 [Nocardioides sp. HM61]